MAAETVAAEAGGGGAADVSAIIDQLARVTQSIFDGLEDKKPQRAVVALLDYAKAYDRVWRAGLLANLARLGVPGCVTNWIAALLRDRRARVRWGEAHSRVSWHP